MALPVTKIDDASDTIEVEVFFTLTTGCDVAVGPKMRPVFILNSFAISELFFFHYPEKALVIKAIFYIYTKKEW